MVQKCITCNNIRVPAPITPTDVPLGLRERKKRERRDALVDAAQRLVRERGLDAVTVEDVCTEVGVSTRTFFNYFATKDDAVLGVEELEITPAVAGDFLAGGPSGDLLTDLQVLVADALSQRVVSAERIAATVALVRAEPRLLARHMSWIESHRSQVAELVARRRAAHPFGPTPELVSLVSMALVHATALDWERSGRVGQPAERLPAVAAQLRELVTPS